MNELASPPPESDPYFAPFGLAAKANGKWAKLSYDEIRLDLLPTESGFRIAGTIGMVLGAMVFIIFAIPVSGMLQVAGEPGGVLDGEDWLWRRWVARMASVFTISLMASFVGFGLRRRWRWTRWFVIMLGMVPLVTLVVGIFMRSRSTNPAMRELGDVMTMPCVGVFILPAGINACRLALTQRARAVFCSDYDQLVRRTSTINPVWSVGLRLGLGLSFSMLILYWTLDMLFLGVLVGFKVIRSV